MKTTILPPDPTRMIEGLRDTGYEFNTAVADIIDNSIAAEASVIDIRVEMDFEGNITIFIADNGYGMDEVGLMNAMKYGSQIRLDPASLGKFGLGLKTASTAFCRSLSVVTRPAGGKDILKARWDLDHVAKVREWELLFPDITPDEEDIMAEVAGDGPGTIVVWEKVDRLIKAYSVPGGSHARNAVNRLVNDLKRHVAMVYQRFLDPGDDRARNLSIFINGEQIFAWDPFCKKLPSTDLVAEQLVPVEMADGSESSFLVKAYVLPRQEDFPSREAAKLARLSNDMQGFYIYRENRLIHYADWLGMFRKEPHGTLLRVEFSFDHTLDDAFNVDIKKSRILLNDNLYIWLKDSFLPAPRRAADERYRKGKRKDINNASRDAHDSSNSSISSREPELIISSVEVVDRENSEVQVTNRNGILRIRLPVGEPVKPGQIAVQPVDGINDGILWEPCLIDRHHAVRINTAHPYYHKVYVPNLASGVIVQGMDSLLWALGEAELGTIDEATRNHFQELRYEVSRLLRKLVEDLPEPELINNGSNS